MTNPANSIHDAFEKLKRSISAQDAHEFASTDLEAVWKAVREIDNTQRKKKSAQNLARIEPLLRGIEKYSKVVDVLCNGTPYLSFIWAPIKLMLQLASEHRDIFEALLSAYADIAAALPRFDRYERAFKDNPEFQNVLAVVYCNILDFHQRAYKFFRRRAWSIIFLSMWNDFHSRFASILKSLKAQRDFVDSEAASIDIVEAKEARAKLQFEIEKRQIESEKSLERNEANDKASRLNHSFVWLSEDDNVQESEYERMSDRRHDGTCEWIIITPQMKTWLEDDFKDSLLWLNGKPGAGKSVMCSYVIQRLKQATGVSVCYFFCGNQGVGTTCVQLLRTIALQLLRYHVDLASLISHDFVNQGSNCGISQLRELIPKMLSLVPCTRIVIDGLDECSAHEQKAIVKEIQTFCLGTSTSCKVLLSSRKETFIQKTMSSKPQVSLDDRKEVSSDIRLYVKHKISELDTSDSDLITRLESVLVEKANGMFLWVRLVADELRHCYNDADLEETVMSLPKGLEKAYGRILNRIIADEIPLHAQSKTIRILEWMACSYRLLKTYELLDGIVFRAPEWDGTIYHPDCTILDSRTKINRKIIDFCKPLIEENEVSHTIDFVHFSAKEFILKHRFRDGKPFINLESAHLNISFSCIAYLNTSLCLLPSNSTDRERTALILNGFHGLQLYANQFWFEHVREYCKAQAQSQKSFSKDILAQMEKLHVFWKETSADSVTASELSTDCADGLDLVISDLSEAMNIFISILFAFRKKQAQNSALCQDPEKLAQEACTTDPTYFSTIRYHYQAIVEALLNAKDFPEVGAEELQLFKDSYGASAFVCRYIHCSRATDGFESARLRNDHEAQHGRKFHCKSTNCASFTIGFATKTSLARHNETYHSGSSEGKTLAEAIAAYQVPTQQQMIGLQQKQQAVARQAYITQRYSYDSPEPVLSSDMSQMNEGQFTRSLGIGGEPMPRPAARVLDGQQNLRKQLASATIQKIIYTALELQRPTSGWQLTVVLQERLGLVYNIIGNLRLAYQNRPNPPTLQNICEIGLKFERDIFEKSPDKAHYKLEVQNKLNQLLERRNQNQRQLLTAINLDNARAS